MKLESHTLRQHVEYQTVPILLLSKNKSTAGHQDWVSLMLHMLPENVGLQFHGAACCHAVIEGSLSKDSDCSLPSGAV